MSLFLRRSILSERPIPYILFANGEEGAWLSQEDINTLFIDTSGVTPVTASGQSEGLILDKSGNGNNATQPTTLGKPTFNDNGTHRWASFDNNDDSILFDVPAGGWNGTYVQGTMEGVIVGQISVPSGTYQIPANPFYENAGTLTELIIRDDGGVIDPAELDQLVDYVGRRGAVADFSGTTSWFMWFRSRTDLVAFDFTRLDLSNFTDGRSTFRSASNLETLVVFDSEGVSPLSSCPCIDYRDFFLATNLSQQSIDDFLVAVNLANTSGVQLKQSGGSAPSAVGEAAIDELRARGGTITVTGGY